MRNPTGWLPGVLVLSFLALPSDVKAADSDAGTLFHLAASEYYQGQYEFARQAAAKASETDPKNADIHVLLAKIYLALGDTDDVVAECKKTLAIAPQESFAAKMLELLQGRKADVNARIAFARALMLDRLYETSAAECHRILDEKSLSKSQRAAVLMLQAELALRAAQYNEALHVLDQVTTLYPKEADPFEIKLLTGAAKLYMPGETSVQGMALLKEFNTIGQTEIAFRAELELILFQLNQSVTADHAKALATWLGSHANFEEADRAREKLFSSRLTLAEKGAEPTAQSPLAEADVALLPAAADLLKHRPLVAEASPIVDHLIQSIESRYAAHGAIAAAADAEDTLLASVSPREVRVKVYGALLATLSKAALARIEDLAHTGKLATADPATLLQPFRLRFDALAIEDPAQLPWGLLAALAADIHNVSARISWPDHIADLKLTDDLAIKLALKVIAKSDDANAVQNAVKLVQTCEKEYQMTGRTEIWPLVLEIDRRLSEAANPKRPVWEEVLTNRLQLLDAYAKFVARENMERGRSDENAKLSAAQKELLETLAVCAHNDADHVGATMEHLAEHLKPWVERDQWAVVEAAYAQLTKSLPEAARWQGELAIARLEAQHVFERDGRTAHVGLVVPRVLDPLAVKALTRCYQLQAGVDHKSPKLGVIRKVWLSFVVHYRNLDYDDIAMAALAFKGKPLVPEADEFAAYETIRLQESIARLNFERSLREFGATDKLALAPELKNVVAAWTKWIVEKPTGPFTPDAIEQLLAVAQLYEQHKAFDTAAAILTDFAKSARTVTALDLSTKAEVGVTQRAAIMAAEALNQQAAKVLAKAIADRKPDDPPPAKLSAEYALVIAAQKSLLAQYPASQSSRDALSKITAVAFVYANIDAWDVAENIYADLLASDLKIRSPEKLEFARGICELGRAMPAHAREVLGQLNATGQGREEDGAENTETALAMSSENRWSVDGGRWSDMADELVLPQRQGGQRRDLHGFNGSVAGMGGGMGGMGGGGMGGRGGASGGGSQNEKGEVAMLDREGDRKSAVSADASDPFAKSGGKLAKDQVDYSAADFAKKPAGGALGMMPESKARPQTAQAKQDFEMVAMLTQQERERSSRIASLESPQFAYMQTQNAPQGIAPHQPPTAATSIAPAELARLDKAINAAYTIFQAVAKKYADTPTAQQSRSESIVMIGFWRSLTQWQRAAQLGQRFLADNPRDPLLPQLRLSIAHDRLAWASKPIGTPLTRPEMMAEIAARFEAAQTELAKIVAEFTADRTMQQEAQWDIAQSYLTEARTISALSPTLARGQFVRAARELRGVAVKYPGHPRIGEIPQMLWGIAMEMEQQGYEDEAVLVCNELAISDPLNPLAQQAIERIAAIYRRGLKRPLKAAETYLELNFIRGGNDVASQGTVFDIGAELKNERRWVESLHVLETFVDSFPTHVHAGQALVMIGQIHQTNLAWDDAIAAYNRAIDEYKNTQWVQEAKWSIAECRINLSQWDEAITAYSDYVTAYPQDGKVAEANRRLDILKDLSRFQELVDEKGQRKAFDAQFQIATIVRSQLANPVKAIIEYRKVVANWPESYVAATALHEIGKAYLGLGETAKAREAFNEVATKYPTSALAGASLFMVGKSYEDEADQLATVTRESTLEKAKELAQSNAYTAVRSTRKLQEQTRSGKIEELKSAGKSNAAELEEANGAFSQQNYNFTNTAVVAQQAMCDVETLTTSQLADRQDKIHAALRKAIDAYSAASKVAGGNKADSALLQMANIYDQRLKDSKAAMETWLEIVRQFSGTAVAQDASWKLAQYYKRDGKYTQAIDAYNSFIRNYRASPNAGAAQFAVAECYEHLGQWVAAMDSYTTYMNNFTDGPLVGKAKEQINWIKTYRL